MSTAIEKNKDSNTYPRYRPAVDIYESAQAYQVQVDLPGVQKEDVSLTLDHERATLEATRRLGVTEPVQYVRTFSLPSTIDRQAVQAELNAGVLTLTLPKQAQVQPRKIEVRAA